MEVTIVRTRLFHQPKKKASAMITALFVLTFMAGINLFLNDQARQTILRLKNEQATTQVKILANQFLLRYREKEIKKLTNKKLGTVELNQDQNLTVKLKKGNTVKVRFNESGY